MLVVSKNCQGRSNIVRAVPFKNNEKCLAAARYHQETPGTKIAIAHTNGGLRMEGWRSLTKREKELMCLCSESE